MTGCLGIDFGTSNSVVALWDAEREEGVPLHVPGYGVYKDQEEGRVSVVPSLIHYTDERLLLGAQVLEHALTDSRQTFRWMKRYISRRTPLEVTVGGRRISPSIAGRDFLTGILLRTAQEIEMEDQEAALAIPIESFEHYEEWLTGVIDGAGIRRIRLIDEASAAALGYGVPLRPGAIYLVFDFGGGSLDVSIVRTEERTQEEGRRCRILGKAGAAIGGATIDEWIFRDLLEESNYRDSDPWVQEGSLAILRACEHVKERLSFADEADIDLAFPEPGKSFRSSYSRERFETLLESRGAFATVHRTVQRALDDARDRGYEESDVEAVLMVGGSSHVPSIRQFLRRWFGGDRVRFGRPLDAVARGAAAFGAGIDVQDYIQHDYALQYVDRETDAYDYRILVPKGTPYPSDKPVCRLRIKPSYDGQIRLGLAIYEMRRDGVEHANDKLVELIFDPSGTPRLTAPSADELRRRSLFWMNEANPTFLTAAPPATKGDARFELTFLVDERKRLVLTALDLETNEITHDRVPVVKLA